MDIRENTVQDNLDVSNAQVNIAQTSVRKRRKKNPNASTVVVHIQPATEVAKETQSIRNIKTNQPINDNTPSDTIPVVTNVERPATIIQPRNIETNMTYANVIQTASSAQKSTRSNQQDANQSLILILEKISSLESSFTIINNRISTLEDRILRSAPLTRQHGLS